MLKEEKLENFLPPDQWLQNFLLKKAFIAEFVILFHSSECDSMGGCDLRDVVQPRADLSLQRQLQICLGFSAVHIWLTWFVSFSYTAFFTYAHTYIYMYVCMYKHMYLYASKHICLYIFRVQKITSGRNNCDQLAFRKIKNKTCGVIGSFQSNGI